MKDRVEEAREKRRETPSRSVKLIQQLPDGPLDIIGDVHGELGALERLLTRLGADAARGHVERPLVFVGDLIDRGPDSPGVIALVRSFVERGLAYCVVGNHELNLMMELKKEGNGWCFGHDDTFHVKREGAQESYYAPFQSRPLPPEERAELFDFCACLPIALVRDDLRVVHSCWDSEQLRRLPEEGSLAALKLDYQRALDSNQTLRRAARKERDSFGELKRAELKPDRLLPHFMERELLLQNENPVVVTTSGKEEPISHLDELDYKGGKWRLLRRARWWESYNEEPAVVVGHYWRRREGDGGSGWRSKSFTDWVGDRGRVFCVDYSAGRRYFTRHQGGTVEGSESPHALAALRWPERTLVFDDLPDPVPTTGWGGG